MMVVDSPFSLWFVDQQVIDMLFLERAESNLMSECARTLHVTLTHRGLVRVAVLDVFLLVNHG